MPSPSATFPRWTWVLFALLYAFIVPWWWPDGDAEVWLGLPRWVVTALLGGLLVAVAVNVLIHRYWRDSPEPGHENTP